MSKKREVINEEDALKDALAPIVNTLIDKNFENSGSKIASQIAPLIGGAIRKQIKNQKDDIVDALYPVMGNMISKFVTKSFEDILNRINNKIQNSFSIATLKRKFKAKIKGVSETELLLEESSEAKIKAVLLIDKKSGTLLCKAEDENNSLSDADMLASMMTAIRSFVNEWVEHNSKFQELGEIEYGGNKIIIETSGYSYLAVIIEGAAYTKTYKKIRTTLEKIVLNHGEEIQKFEGNFEILDKKSIEKELQSLLLHSDSQKETKTNKLPLFLLLSIIILSLFWSAYIFYEKSIDRDIQKNIYSNIEATPQLLPFHIEVDVNKRVATINGRVPFQYHKELLLKKIKNISGLKAIHNNIAVIPTLTDPLQVSANIAYLLKGINIENRNNIKYNFDYNSVELYGKVKDKQTKKKLLDALKKIKGIQEIKENIKIQPPKIDEKLYFQRNSTKLNDTTKKKVLKIIEKIENNKITAPLELKVYSDMVGNKKINRKLAEKRVQNIQLFLKNKNIKNPIEYQIFDTPPPNIDALKNPEKARCITITTKRKDNVEL